MADQIQLGYDAFGVDWTVEPKLARYIFGGNVCLQGNLDPVALQADPESLAEMTKKMVDGFGKKSYIANLGHGIYPDADPEHLRVFIDAVHNA